MKWRVAEGRNIFCPGAEHGDAQFVSDSFGHFDDASHAILIGGAEKIASKAYQIGAEGD